MSATRDKGSRIAFVYSNLYRIYRDTKNESEKQNKGLEKVAIPTTRTDQNILKVGDLKSGEFASRVISEYQPTEFIAKKVDLSRTKEELLKVNPPELPSQEVLNRGSSRGGVALDSLKSNLKQLNDLHCRLKFMLGELEDILKK